jgi:hypothetical protein
LCKGSLRRPARHKTTNNERRAGGGAAEATEQNQNTFNFKMSLFHISSKEKISLDII